MVAADGASLEADLRAELELLLRRIAAAGHIPDRGTRDVLFRLNADDRVAWFSATSVRVPATELERGFDETAPAI